MCYATFLFSFAGGADERDELCPSMYSFHSSLEEKNQLLHTLTTYGIETTVDHSKKKDRIREWIQASAIVEETEGDESDMYEDSEFYEDEDGDNDGNESEEAEPVSMRGRHFPERRPSATNDLRKRRGSRVAPARKAASKNKVAVKPVERKIPFAPQVAEERKTIARFASFPNGDPSLAAMKNGSDQTRDLTTTNVTSDVSSTTNNLPPGDLRSSVLNANGQNVRNSAKANVDSPRDELSVTAVTTSSAKQSPPKIMSGNPDAVKARAESRIPMSPQIPARKNRAHTAPFPDARSAENRNRESARRAQSATILPTPETNEGPSPPRTSTKTSTRTSPHPMTFRADGTSVATSSTPRTTRSAAPVVRNDRASSITSNAILAEPQHPNSVLPSRVEGSPPNVTQITTPTNALAMSTASHLAIQSFNALQNIVGTSSSPSPANSLSNVNKSGQQIEEMTVTYGKDAYEHYGIAQGALLPMRLNIVRQDSTGSGNRSASN